MKRLALFIAVGLGVFAVAALSVRAQARRPRRAHAAGHAARPRRWGGAPTPSTPLIRRTNAATSRSISSPAVR